VEAAIVQTDAMTKPLLLAIALLGVAAPAFAGSPTACEVLTKTDLAAVQGQAFTEATLSTTTQGSVSVSQCFYRLPAFERSVSVTLMRPRSPGDRTSVRDYWAAHYAASLTEKRDDRDHAKDDRDDDEHPSKAVRLPGLGDDAVWSGTPMASVLRILANGTIVRISVGGPAPVDQKLAASRRLAGAILARLGGKR
jgi:hypothetical protein